MMSGFDIGAVGLNSLVPCPFEPAHIMKFSKFHSHIVKCQKKHPEDKRKPCPYNFSEFIDPDKMAEHMEVCPYRNDYGSRKWTDEDTLTKRYVKPCDIDFGYVEEETNDTGGFDNDGRDEDMDDQIDSVSVLSEKYGTRDRANSTQSVNRSEKSTACSSSSVNVGRGRAAFFARRGIPISRFNPDKDSSSSISKPSDQDGGFSILREGNIRPKPANQNEGFSILREENIRPTYTDTEEFSILREANIHPMAANQDGETSIPREENMRPTSSEVTKNSRTTANDNDDERIAFLEKLRADVEKKHFPTGKGRGRGMLFKRR